MPRPACCPACRDQWFRRVSAPCLLCLPSAIFDFVDFRLHNFLHHASALLAWDIASNTIPFISNGLSGADNYELAVYSMVFQDDVFLNYLSKRNAVFNSVNNITAKNLYNISQYCYLYLKTCFITREAALASLANKTSSTKEKIQPLIDYQNNINSEIAKILVELKGASRTNEGYVFGFLPSDNKKYLAAYDDSKMIAWVTAKHLVKAEIVASGECGDKGDNVAWTLDADGTLDISGNGGIGNAMFGGEHAPGWLDMPQVVRRVIIHNGVTFMDPLVFGSCSNLTSVTIPNSITSIDFGVFVGCNKLTDVYYSGTKAQWEQIDIDTVLDQNAPLLNATTHCDDGDIPPKGVVPAENRCGDNLTWELDNDGTLTIQGTGKMWTFDLPVPAPWWKKGELIKKVILKDGVTSIGYRAFEGYGDAMNLTSVTIPITVTEIQEYAFSECSGLKDVYYSGTEAQWRQIQIHNDWDDNAPLLNATIHYNGSDLGRPHDGKCGDNLTWKLENGVLTISGTGEMWGFDYMDFSEVSWHENKDAITEVVIEDGVTSIGKWAFCECENLENVTIPDSVIGIWDWAFTDCSSLTSITIPYNNAWIGEIAFGGCSSLKSISIPANTTDISKCAFADCSSLTSIVIPDKVTDIWMYAFEGCTNLSYVVMPSSVTSIGQFAFDDCDNLSDVYYSGTEEKWQEIYFDERAGNAPLLNATIHYNSTGP